MPPTSQSKPEIGWINDKADQNYVVYYVKVEYTDLTRTNII